MSQHFHLRQHSPLSNPTTTNPKVTSYLFILHSLSARVRKKIVPNKYSYLHDKYLQPYNEFLLNMNKM